MADGCSFSAVLPVVIPITFIPAALPAFIPAIESSKAVLVNSFFFLYQLIKAFVIHAYHQKYVVQYQKQAPL